MSKWTWPALAALLAVAAGSYYLLSQRQERSSAGEATDLDVEAFGEDAEADEGGDNVYEMLDGAEESAAPKTPPSGTTPADEGIKTIDDEDDLGETVDEPVVIDDEDGSVESPEPTP